MFYLFLSAILATSAVAHNSTRDIGYNSTREEGKPHECVHILLYDMFGEGWGLDTQLAINDRTFDLVSNFELGINNTNATQCHSRVHRICNESAQFEIRMISNSTMNVTNLWETIFGVKYLKKSYFGTIGSEVKINHGKVSYSNIFDYTDPHENKCRPCKHRYNDTNGDNDSTSHAISLHDARGKRWYKKTGDFVNIEDFKVPSVLVYPRYYISDSSETDLLVENTMCAPKGDEVCVENLPDGEYTFRVGGYAQDDESWSFCNVSGVVGEQITFNISGVNCTVIGNKTVADHVCMWGVEDDDQQVALAWFDESLFQDEVLGGSSVMWFAEVSGVSILLIAAIMLVVSKVRERSSFDALPQESENQSSMKKMVWI